MIIQDYNKYNTQKYRFAVRRTNSKIICQVIYATIKGDKVMASATSQELKKYGIETGLTNYAAAYATGLLLARRLLKSLKMDSMYKGADKTTGEDFDVCNDANEEKQPFKAVLDVGIVSTTTGNRAFGALKGACDGGLHIPHSIKRYPGYKDGNYDAKAHRERIFGVHVDNYMKDLKEDSKEDFQKQFGLWEKVLKKAGVDSVEKLYEKAHAEIRKNPALAKKEVKNPKRVSKKIAKLTNAQKKANVQAKIKIALESQE